MSFRSSLDLVTQIIVVVSFISTFYLYLYPAWFGCAFPSANHGSQLKGYRNTIAQHLSSSNANTSQLAPFRLLVLADPQLEGDSSFPDPEDAFARRLSRHKDSLQNATVLDFGTTLLDVIGQVVLEDVPEALWTVRKTIDLFGNDYYLAHIFRTLHWWSKPTHVTVLGDLIGSQWTSDEEFNWRGWRFWNRVFAKGKRVEDEYMELYKRENAKDILFPIGQDKEWQHRIVNIAGNHDIGYAGDITQDRMDRFERVFGHANWDIQFVYPNISDSTPPTIHLIVLNDMLFDTPALNESLQTDTYNYVNSLIGNRLSPVENRNTTFTLLLTHVPLHKPAGVCVDEPFFDFWDSSDGGGAYLPHGLKEQNHLSDHSSHSGILESIFGMSNHPHAPVGGKGRHGLILSGHDHEGCDVWHYLPSPSAAEKTVSSASTSDNEVPSSTTTSSSSSSADSTSDYTDSTVPANDETENEKEKRQAKWRSAHTSVFNPSTANMHTGIREVTLRSMMGSFSGNAGLLSLWYDFERGHWDYAIQMCALGVQHTWWTIHVIDAVAVVLLVVQAVLRTRSMLLVASSNTDNRSGSVQHKRDTASLKKTQ